MMTHLRTVLGKKEKQFWPQTYNICWSTNQIILSVHALTLLMIFYRELLSNSSCPGEIFCWEIKSESGVTPRSSASPTPRQVYCAIARALPCNARSTRYMREKALVLLAQCTTAAEIVDTERSCQCRHAESLQLSS